jgi:phosphoribosylaminoimidazole carboxylase (NCAIR synthetase)
MYYHDYNKAARPGRNLGHITIMASIGELIDGTKKRTTANGRSSKG